MRREGREDGKREEEVGGCLIYWFNSCRCPSLSLSVREGKWSMQSKTPRPNHIFSQLLSLLLTVSVASLCRCLAPSLTFCLSVSLLHFPPSFLSPTHWLTPTPHIPLWDEASEPSTLSERICSSRSQFKPLKQTWKMRHGQEKGTSVSIRLLH